MSSELSINYSEDENQQLELCWEEAQIPSLYTPVNTLELLKNKRIVIIVWYLDETTNGFEVMGQLNVPMFGFTQLTPDSSPFMNAFEMDLTNVNEVVGKVDFKMMYHLKTCNSTN